MKTISFNISESVEIQKIISVLKFLGAKNIKSSDKITKFLPHETQASLNDTDPVLPDYLLLSLEKSLRQAENNEVIDDAIVQKEISQICHSK